jgi:uncharacterized protein
MTTRPPASPPRVRRAPLLLAMLLLCGCSLLWPPRPRPTQFYVLTALSAPGAVAPGRRLTLGLGPISLPAYLDRPEMVTRVAPNQLQFDEFNRWSESLKSNFINALATDLDTLIGFERLVVYPWYNNTKLDYAVSVAVLRFETQPDGTVELSARWGVSDGRGTIYLNRDSHFTQPLGGTSDTAADTATALSELVNRLAVEIATGLREVDAAPKK